MAVAGFDSREAVLLAAVFQLASIRMMTSGSSATIDSQPSEVPEIGLRAEDSRACHP